MKLRNCCATWISNEKNENAEEFLETLDDKVLEGRLGDFEILGAISTVLQGDARRWWRTSQDRISTWVEFKEHFRRAYVREIDEEDLWSDLRHCTQAEKEKISSYILSLRHIVRHLAYPPSEHCSRTATCTQRIAMRWLTECRCHSTS